MASTPTLVVVTGPIGSGKSTVCTLLTDRLVSAGLTVVPADLDEVAEMVHAPGGRTGEHWDQAHHVHGALVAAWLRSAVDVVVAHGPVYTRAETDALMVTVPARTPVFRVLLLASFGTAAQRVSGDLTRGLSRDLSFLRATYDRFASVRPGIEPCDLTVDTDQVPAERTAADIAERLLRDRWPARARMRP